MPEFREYPKIARLNRPIVVTEKLDGTNGVIHFTEAGEMLVGSRTRWITPADDNHGFARWAEDHREDLASLGPGTHYGEWWGLGINRGYGLKEKRFSLFNTARWGLERPSCCGVVPVLYHGPFNEMEIHEAMRRLREGGSVAAVGFMRPEGVVIFHTAANLCLKATLERDDAPKGQPC